jgi:hypothetical protein
MEVEYSTTVTANTTEPIFSTLRTVVVTEPYVDVPLVVTLGEFYFFKQKNVIFHTLIPNILKG